MSGTRLGRAVVIGGIAAAALLPTSANAAPLAGDELGGYRVRIEADSTTRTTFEVPSIGRCDAQAPLPYGMVTVVMQWGSVRFAGVHATAQCLPGQSASQLSVALLTAEKGQRTLPQSKPGDQVSVRITNSDGRTVVTVANETRGWRVQDHVRSIGAAEYQIGDTTSGAAGMSQELADFGAHQFARTVIDGQPLAEWEPARSSVSDWAGAKAEPTGLRGGGTSFAVRYVKPGA